MNKSLLGLCLSLLLVSSFSVNATIPNPFTGTIQVTIPIGSCSLTTTSQGEQVTVDGFGRLLIPGKPNLPSKIFSIAIPPGSTIDSIETLTNDTPLFGHHAIPPCLLPRALGPEDPQSYEQRHNEYTTNYIEAYFSYDPYPSTISEIIGMGGYRKYNLVDVRINPVTYEPLNGVLTFHAQVSLIIHFSSPPAFLPKRPITDNLQATEEHAKAMILNYDEAQQWYPTSPLTRGLYEYVAITTDCLVSSINPLAWWENAKGRSVAIVTTTWINDSYQGLDLAEKIRSFLRDKYPSEEWGIQDVCLVGDYDDIPMRLTVYGPETDFYYAELSLPDNQSWDGNHNGVYGENGDPIDFEAEVNVGRIPWSEPDTVQSICEKSVAYEQKTDESFKKNILLLGAFFWNDTDNAVLMEAKTDQPWMEDWAKTRLYEIPQSTYSCDYDLTYENVEDVWSSGTYAFVDWAGHGMPDASYELYPVVPFIDKTSILSLNDSYPAIIFGCSCSNADTDYLNIGQALLKHGGVGFLGSNKIAHGCYDWDDPMDGSSQTLDYFFTTCVTSGNYTQGQAHQWALYQMYINNLWGLLRFEAFEWGSLWGNPDLSMAPVSTSNPPATPSLAGPTQGSLCVNCSFTSETTDPDDDSVFYVFDWGDGSTSGWLGPYPSGATITAQHAWPDVGNYTIHVKARDLLGVCSAWSEPLIITIIVNRPPGTPLVSGPSTGAPRKPYTYDVQASDPNGDNVTFFVDWGDGNMIDWFGPFASGEEVSFNHSWAIRGSYTVKVKARDSAGLQSDWGTLSVRMPYRPPYWDLLQRLLDRFPNAFPILRGILEQ